MLQHRWAVNLSTSSTGAEREGQPEPAAGALADVMSRTEVLEAHVADLRGKAGRQAKVASQQERLIAAEGL